MTLQVINGPFIQKGESLSDAVDATGGELVRITMPGAWDPDANLTFQISSDGAMFNDLVDVQGNEIQIAVTPGSAVVVRGGQWTKAFAYIKVRSGTRDNPIPQNDLREFSFAVEPPPGVAP
jgi:hypothetical protein